MPEATDRQMQAYADQRIRVFAEKFRSLLAEARDHKTAVDDCYSRAAGSSRWSDARTDGPPRLLQAGNSAEPDDFLNFNAFISLFIDFADGNLNLTNLNDLPALWAVLDNACVRPVNSQ